MPIFQSGRLSLVFLHPFLSKYANLRRIQFYEKIHFNSVGGGTGSRLPVRLAALPINRADADNSEKAVCCNYDFPPI